MKSDSGLEAGVRNALQCLPGGIFLVTARHEDRRAGLLTSWVQQCCGRPPMLSIAVPKGAAIMPLISESAAFAACHLDADDRIIHRKFRGELGLNDDPFLGFELLRHTLTHSPVIASAAAFFECTVTCHMDVDGDHDVFVGRVVNGRMLNGRPAVRIPEIGVPLGS